MQYQCLVVRPDLKISLNLCDKSWCLPVIAKTFRSTNCNAMETARCKQHRILDHAFFLVLCEFIFYFSIAIAIDAFLFFFDSMTNVIAELRSCGYSVLPANSQQVSDMYFCLDNLFDDTIVFSSEQALELSSHWLVQHGHLVIQVMQLFSRYFAILLSLLKSYSLQFRLY